MHIAAQFKIILKASAGLGSILIFSLVVIGANYLQSDQSRFAFAHSDNSGYIHIDPSLTNTVISAIDQYTPIIEESLVDLETILPGNEYSGFASSDRAEDQFETKETQLERQYIVQKGDTMIGIARKFNLTVATILERNNLSVDKIESLSTGMVLIIPPKDTSNSTDWLVALNKKKAEEAKKRALAVAARNRSRVLSATTRSSSGFDKIADRNFIVPIKHNGITRGLSRHHMGIDYRANTGTAVVAASEGRVIELTRGWSGGFGLSVLIDHGGGLTTRYAHLAGIAAEIGQIVSGGQVVGYSGNTGYSTGPHLHLETRLNGRAINPF